MAVWAFDTNVLAYAVGIGQSEQDALKADVADALLARAMRTAAVVLPVQVCLELHNLLVRKGGLPAGEAAALVRDYADGMQLIDSDIEVLDAALNLAERHRLQTYDAVILAAAARAGCDVLYSEDMQDGFEWEGVRVVNPFR